MGSIDETGEVDELFCAVDLSSSDSEVVENGKTGGRKVVSITAAPGVFPLEWEFEVICAAGSLVEERFQRGRPALGRSSPSA